MLPSKEETGDEQTEVDYTPRDKLICETPDNRPCHCVGNHESMSSTQRENERMAGNATHALIQDAGHPASLAGGFDLLVRFDTRMTSRPTRDSRSSAKDIRQATETKIEQLRSKGTSAIVLGIAGLVLLAMTFLTVRPRTPGGISPSNLSGYDLAVGYITKPPVTTPLGATYSIIWLIAAGSGLAMLFGFIATLPSMRSRTALSKSSVKHVSKLIGIAGIVIIISAAMTAIEISTASDIGIFLGSDYTFSLGWPLFAEMGVGVIVIITAIWA